MRRMEGRKRPNWLRGKNVNLLAVWAMVFAGLMYCEHRILLSYRSHRISRIGFLKNKWSVLYVEDRKTSSRLVHPQNPTKTSDRSASSDAIESQGGKPRKSVTTTTGAGAPWRASQVLPQWMKEYFQWHQDALRKIRDPNGNSWQNYSYMVVRCLEIDVKCGGGADRLMPLPFMLLLAHRTNRLLFFSWERPAALEEFLVPPPDGLNWTWPPHPAIGDPNNNFHFSNAPDIRTEDVAMEYLGIGIPALSERKQSPLDSRPVISVRYQSHNHGRVIYDVMRSNNETEAPFIEVFRDCWYSVFAPSPPVQKLIDWRMQQLRLKPNQYHAIHIRSRYNKQLRNDQIRRMAFNSVNCLEQIVAERNYSQLQLNASTPIFVASDARQATQATAELAHLRGLKHIATTQGIFHPTETDTSIRQMLGEGKQKAEEEVALLHLDRGSNFVGPKIKGSTRYEAQEYFDTFVDLYLLSKSRCIVFGIGNYGRWANLLSDNIWCHRDTGYGPKSKTHCS